MRSKARRAFTISKSLFCVPSRTSRCTSSRMDCYLFSKIWEASENLPRTIGMSMFSPKNRRVRHTRPATSSCPAARAHSNCPHRCVQQVLYLHLHDLRQAKSHDGAGTLAYTAIGRGAMHAWNKQLRTCKQVVSVREQRMEEVHEGKPLLQTAHHPTQSLLPAALPHAAPNVLQELLELDLDSCEILLPHLRRFVRVREEESESASVRYKVLHKSRHREKTPQEFSRRRTGGCRNDRPPSGTQQTSRCRASDVCGPSRSARLHSRVMLACLATMKSHHTVRSQTGVSG